jgi:predicted transcriptional regulator
VNVPPAATSPAFRIWLLRHRANVPQRALGFLLGVSPSYISAIECGHIECPISFKKAIERALSPVIEGRTRWSR